jgi:hypothetical protein
VSDEEIKLALGSATTAEELTELHKRVFGVEPVIWGENFISGFPFMPIVEAISIGKPYEEEDPQIRGYVY